MAETLRDDPRRSHSRRRRAGSGTARTTSYCMRLTLAGHVQGVGFRPFVYRLAREYGVLGTVQNRLGEVEIVACGRQAVLRRFREALIRRAPPLARPEIVKVLPEESAAYLDFSILPSARDAEARIFVPPDYFMCADCERELADPADRRHAYPFINCTQCGPRYTLIEALPYDRPNTSIAGFPLCADCAAEYGDPGNRRFHAEPIACPICGPTLALKGDGCEAATG
ncbi:MAG: acylphosphatase, partial [Woeseiaceae bacterium]|nr:acylphosphatase [Woeseiaceae bacterium]